MNIAKQNIELFRTLIKSARNTFKFFCAKKSFYALELPPLLVLTGYIIQLLLVNVNMFHKMT